MTKPSYEELRITKHSGSPQIADSASGGKSSKTAPEIRKALRSAAKLAENPYSDEVAAFGYDEPLAVGRKIAKAIRRLLR